MNKKMNEHLISQCLQVIKRKLKERNMTYVDIADILAVSQNTVKRMLNAKDISFERLLTLAELCGLKLDTLLEEAKARPTPYNYFTSQQDEAFYRMPNLWHYFSELFYYSKSPETIQKENDITELSTYRYLRAMEKLSLLELLPNNNIKFLIATPIGFSSDSLVLKTNIARFIKSTCNTVISGQKSQQHFMWVKPIRMPLSLFKKMNEELVTIINKYTEVAEIAFVNDLTLPEFQTTLVGHPLDLGDYKDADIIDIDEI
jgi:transcriptional regulator with XRE-family HTH domain